MFLALTKIFSKLNDSKNFFRSKLMRKIIRESIKLLIFGMHFKYFFINYQSLTFLKSLNLLIKVKYLTRTLEMMCRFKKKYE